MWIVQRLNAVHLLQITWILNAGMHRSVVPLEISLRSIHIRFKIVENNFICHFWIPVDWWCDFLIPLQLSWSRMINQMKFGISPLWTAPHWWCNPQRKVIADYCSNCRWLVAVVQRNRVLKLYCILTSFKYSFLTRVQNQLIISLSLLSQPTRYHCNVSFKFKCYFLNVRSSMGIIDDSSYPNVISWTNGVLVTC